MHMNKDYIGAIIIILIISGIFTHYWIQTDKMMQLSEQAVK
jgi:hypothetical protein